MLLLSTPTGEGRFTWLHPILNQSFCLCATQVCPLPRGLRVLILLNHTQSPKHGGIPIALRRKAGCLPYNLLVFVLIDFLIYLKYVKALLGFGSCLKEQASQFLPTE